MSSINFEADEQNQLTHLTDDKSSLAEQVDKLRNLEDKIKETEET
jgi:hypothetical protein